MKPPHTMMRPLHTIGQLWFKLPLGCPPPPPPCIIIKRLTIFLMRLHVHTSSLRGIAIRLLARTEMRWQLPLILWVLPLLLAAQAPAKPTGLTATAGPGSGEVTLIWDNPDNSAITRYQFQARVSGSTFGWGNITGSNASTTRHVATGITNDTETDFRVRAFVGNTEGTPSDWASATPMAVVTPPKITGVTATAGDGQVTLTWNNPDNPVISDYQYRQGSGSPLVWESWTDIGSSDANTTEHTVTGLTNGTEYSFAVRARIGTTTGPESTPYAMATPQLQHEFSISLSAASAAENNSGSSIVATGTISISNALTFPVSFSLCFAGTATEGTDYTLIDQNTTSRLTFRTASSTNCGADDGSLLVFLNTSASSWSFRIQVSGDATIENDETIIVSIGGVGLVSDGDASRLSISPTAGSATFTIEDDDSPTATFAAATSSADEDDGTVTVAVNLSANATMNTDVVYSVSGTATSATDFTALSGTVQITSGTNTANISIPITDDTTDEPSETLILTLNNSLGYKVGTTSVHTLTISDNDATTVTLSVPDNIALEASSTDRATVQLSLNRALRASESLAIPLAFSGGVLGTDFSLSLSGTPTGVALSSNTVTFMGSGSGSAMTAEVLLSASSDADATDRTITVNIPSSSSGATPILTATNLDGGATGSRTGNGQIVLNDDDKPMVSFAAASSSADEDDGTVTVGLNISPAPTSSVLVNYTVSGTATDGTDFSDLVGGGFVVGTNITEFVLRVNITDDNVDEPAETIILTLSSGVGYNVGSTSVHTLTITDNDVSAFVLTPTSLKIDEGASGTYTVKLATRPTGGIVEVIVSGASGEVTVDTDTGTDGDQNTLIFTTSDWNMDKTVTVSAGQDDDSTNDIATLSHSASGGGYDSVTGDVEVAVRDEEAVIVSLARSGTGGIDEGETVEFTVALDRALVAGDTLDVPMAIGGTGVTAADWSLALKTGTGLNTGVTLSGEDSATPQVTLASAGADTATLVLTAIRDSDNAEGAETFNIALGPNDTSTNGFGRDGLASNVGADPSTSANSFEVAVTNIPPDTVSFNSTAVMVGEGEGTADLTVQLSGARSTPTTIIIGTLSTSASENSDYIPGPFPFTIPAGETEGVLSIEVLEDMVDEQPERFNAFIASALLPAGVVLDSPMPPPVAITILDNDPTGVELRGVSDTLEWGARRNFSVTLSRALMAGEVLEVPLTYGGTAVQGTHYTLTHPDPLPRGVTYDGTNLTGGTVIFTGPSAEAVTLTLRAATEPNRKTVDIGLGTLNAGSGTNLDGGASGTDNFEEFTLFTPVTMGIGIPFRGGTLPEGTTTEFLSFFFSRRLNDADAEILRFPITLGGDATQGTDYTLTCGAPIIGVTNFGVTCSNLDSSTPVIIVDRTIFGNGKRGAFSFNINVIADDAVEEPESLTLTSTDAESVVNLTLIEAPASVMVNFTADTFRVAENEPPLTIVFRLDALTGRDLTIPLMYTDVTTTTGVDYTPVSEFVIKANGEITHELFIPIKASTSSSDPDVMDELDETFTLTMGTAPEGLVKGSRSTTTVVIEDSNPTEVTLSGALGNVAEGGTKEITLSLGRGLVDGEGLAVPLTFEGTAVRGTDYTVTCPNTLPDGVTCNDLNTDDAPTVTFIGPATGMTATSVTLTLTATDDEDTESGGEIVNIGLGTLDEDSGTGIIPSRGGASGNDELADFRITDDAIPVTVSSLAMTVTEAAGSEQTADYTIVLNSTPNADVTITVTSSDTDAVTVDTNLSMDGAQSTLTFTSTTWNEQQTVTVSAVDDNMDQNTDRTATLRHRAASSDTNYEGTIIDDVAVTVVDDEPTLVTLTAAAGDVREGSTKEITLSLGRGLVDGQVLEVPLTFGGTATRGIDYTVDCQNPSPEGVRCGDFTRRSAQAVEFAAPETGMTAASVTLTLTAISDDEEESGGETVDIVMGTLNVERSTTLSGGAMGMDNVAAFRIKDPISPPAKPTGFTATAAGKQVTLNWTDPTNSDITGYQFQQKTGGGSFGDDWTDIAGSDAATTTHTVSGLTNGTAYTFRIRAVAGTMNGAPSDEETATPANTAPTVANPISDQTATVGTAFSYQFPENTFSDADSDALSYAATQGDDSPLPTWLAFDDATRTFSGTPQAADVGTLNVKVTADDDNGGMISDVFDITVNALPVVTIAAGTSPVTEGTDATFTVTATPAPTADLMVNLSVTEAGGGDFVAGANEGSGKTVTIPANSSSATYTVTTVADDMDEPNGSVTMTVTNGSGYATGTPSEATVTVNDDDEALLGAVEDEGETVIVPNPSDGYIEVRSTGTSGATGEAFKILSLSGKPLLKGTTNTRTDITSLRSGLYLVQLSDGRLLKFVRE